MENNWAKIGLDLSSSSEEEDIVLPDFIQQKDPVDEKVPKAVLNEIKKLNERITIMETGITKLISQQNTAIRLISDLNGTIDDLSTKNTSNITLACYVCNDSRDLYVSECTECRSFLVCNKCMKNKKDKRQCPVCQKIGGLQRKICLYLP